MRKRTGYVSRGVAVLAACCLLAACDRQASTEELISRATQYMQQGDYKSATIELKNAVASDVNNARARWLLGKTYFESGDLESAEKELGRARELGAPGADVLPLLAQVQGALGRHDELMSLGSEGLPADAQATVLAAQGLALLGKGELEEAGKRLEQAVTLVPNSAYVGVAHARLLLANGQMEAGRKELEQVVGRESGYAPAWSLLGDLEQQQQHPDLAEKAYTKSLETDANNFGDRLKRALLRIQLQQSGKAAEDVAALRKSAPKHPGTFFAQGMLHLQKNELDEAKEALEQAVRAGNSFPLTLFYLAAIHAQQGNQVLAETYTGQFLDVAPGNPLGRNLAASLAMRAGEFARAEQLVRPVVAANDQDVVALNTLAAALLAQGKTDEGLDLLTKVAQLQPDSAVAQTRLAAGLLAAGDGGVGVEHLRKALELDPHFQQADVLLVLNLLQKHDLEGALRAAEDFRKRNPDAVTPYNLLGRIHLAARDADKARAAFARALEIAPGDPGASQSLAALAAQAKDFEGARGYYVGVLDKHPDYVPVLMQLAALDLTQGKESAMAERLEGLVKTYPAAVEPRLALARYKTVKGRGADALALLSELDASQKAQPAVLAQMAEAQLAQGDYGAARMSLGRLVRLQPDNAWNHYRLALAHDGLGDTAAVRKALERAIELDPKHLPARVALARLLLAQKKSQQFEAQLVALRQMQPEHPDVLLLEAALANSRGDDVGVLEKLEQAFAVAPAPATVQALAIEKVRRGVSGAGVKLLEDWLSGHEDDAATRMTLADVYGSSDRVDDAIAQYRRVLDASPDNVVALNNLAWHLRKRDPKQALVFAERAHTRAPDSGDVLDTLALVLLENRDLRQAQARIEQALKVAPENSALRYHAALIRHAAGDTDGALIILEPLLESEKEFAERREAAEFVASIKK